MKKKYYIFFLLLLPLLLFSCNKKSKTRFKRNQNIHVSIAIQSVHLSSITEHIRVGAQVASYSNVSLTPNVGGTIKTIIKKEGSFVKKNTILLYVDSSKAGKNFLPNPVKSPIDGVIASIPLGVGNTVTTKTVIAVVVNNKKKHVTAFIPEKKILTIKKGLSALFYPIAFPTINVPLSISEISSKVSKNHLGNIILTFNSPRKNKKVINKLLPGMYGSLLINIRTHKNKIVVDRNVIVIKPHEGTYTKGVFTIIPSQKNPKVIFRPVITGIENNNKIEIIKGIKEGDFIVTEGQEFIFQDATPIIMKINGRLQKNNAHMQQ